MFANRVWKQLFGRGLVEPEDDMRMTNPSTNEPLLDYLANQAIESQFDRKALMRLIGPMKIEMIGQEGSGIHAEPVVLTPEASTASVEVQMPAGPLIQPVPIKFRATGQLPGYVNIITEAEVTVTADNSPKPNKVTFEQPVC